MLSVMVVMDDGVGSVAVNSSGGGCCVLVNDVDC